VSGASGVPDTDFYFHADGLGSIVALTDASGQLVETYRYDVYGQPIIQDASGSALAVSSVGNRYLFTGREYDSETGLYYYRARYYHPGVGRFLSRDPLGYLPDINVYRYVGNNPASFIDPFGLAKTGSGTSYDEFVDALSGNGGFPPIIIGVGVAAGAATAAPAAPVIIVGLAGAAIIIWARRPKFDEPIPYDWQVRFPSGPPGYGVPPKYPRKGPWWVKWVGLAAAGAGAAELLGYANQQNDLLQDRIGENE